MRFVPVLALATMAAFTLATEASALRSSKPGAPGPVERTPPTRPQVPAKQPPHYVPGPTSQANCEVGSRQRNCPFWPQRRPR